MVISALILLLSSFAVFSKAESCPKIINESRPFTYEGCSGEACGYLKYYKALRKVELHSTPDDKSKIIGHIEKCENIKAAKFFTSVTDIGEGTIVSNIENGKNLKSGEKIRVIRSSGEGFWQICGNDNNIFTATDSSSPPEIEFKLIKQPKTQDWIQLKTKNGILGYAKDSYPRFFMGYYDFDPNGFCNEDHPLGSDVEKSKTQLSSFISRTLKDACSTFRGCIRDDPTMECPIDLKVWDLLSKELKKYPKLIQCAGFGGGNSCTQEWTGTFSCTYEINSSLNPDIANQTIFQYSCKKSSKQFDCRLN